MTGARTGRHDGRRIASAIALVLAALPVPAGAEGTAAGTAIVNTARLAFGNGPDAGTVPSNTVVLTVVRVIDVAVTAAATRQSFGSDAPERVTFQVRNPGNAPERYTLSATAAFSLAVVTGIVVGADGASPPGPAASTTIYLQPGESRSVVVLVRVGPDANGAPPADFPVTLTATAVAGHGAPGTVLPGDPAAVVGATGARASARTILGTGTAGGLPPGQPGAGSGTPTLIKSQSVRAPDGSARVIRGSVVTYRLQASFGDGAAAVVVDDPIPAGTAYVAGSLTLDGAAMSDAPDDDAGRFDGSTIRVALGDAAAGTARTIQFQAVIQ